MSLYAIGDLHLHFNSELKAPGQLHDRVWKNHEQKFLKNCSKLLTEEDTLVLVGDHLVRGARGACGRGARAFFTVGEDSLLNPSPSFVNLNGSVSTVPSEDRTAAKWLSLAISMPT